jgi:hypothetical protein
MARITISSGQRLRVIANLAGSNMQDLSLTIDQFDVPDVTQTALDAALADYIANQAAREAAFDSAERDADTVKEQERFDDERLTKAVVKWAAEEINNLRALHSLPALTNEQVRTAIRDKVAGP